MLLAALAFRRGAGVLAALPLALLLTLPGPAHAAAEAGGWWRRADQQAQQQIERGVDAYRQGDFAAAGQAFAAAGARGAEADYNLGNALARQGRYDDAIAAYDRALAQAPAMEDAIANRKVVDAARKQQNQQNQQQDQPQDQPQDSRQSGASGKPAPGQDPEPPKAEDAQERQRQEQADREQRQRMQQALEQGQERQAGGQEEPAQAREDSQAREQRQAREAWLRRVPDDPGGLLRAKFRLEYERRQQEGR